MPPYGHRAEAATAELQKTSVSDARLKLDGLHKLISEFEYKLRHYTMPEIGPFDEPSPSPSTKDVGQRSSIFDDIDYATLRLARILTRVEL